MDFFKAVDARRSIRRYTEESVPKDVIMRALEAAFLAPNSSNVQTWDFWWIKTAEKKKALIQYCMNQSAARTAQELLVVTADPAQWKRSHQSLKAFIHSVSAPKVVILYYERLIPWLYRWGFLNCLAPIKWLVTNVIGLFRPIARGPYTLGDLQEVASKSAALAAENFVLAISAQGFATCMMEGFDKRRVKKMLKLPHSARVVMVISVGRAHERGTWGPRYRIDTSLTVKEI